MIFFFLWIGTSGKSEDFSSTEGSKFATCSIFATSIPKSSKVGETMTRLQCSSSSIPKGAITISIDSLSFSVKSEVRVRADLLGETVGLGVDVELLAVEALRGGGVAGMAGRAFRVGGIFMSEPMLSKFMERRFLRMVVFM
eukprot:Lithocolla_globosa_v1_NODE_328_length_4454_cov_14.999318.p3 type:complete len:141 gc:universal NODE_328_length_4454_cov_14.999318:1691-1269(-)